MQIYLELARGAHDPGLGRRGQRECGVHVARCPGTPGSARLGWDGCRGERFGRVPGDRVPSRRARPRRSRWAGWCWAPCGWSATWSTPAGTSSRSPRPPSWCRKSRSLVAAVRRLPVSSSRRIWRCSGARTLDELEARLRPTITSAQSDTGWTCSPRAPSLDGRHHYGAGAQRDVQASAASSRRVAPSPSGADRATGAVPQYGCSPTPSRSPRSRGREIFNPDFSVPRPASLGRPDSTRRVRRLEREVRGVELLSSREKLMAGLPTFATYFGRDGMMTALMMRPIWTPGDGRARDRQCAAKARPARRRRATRRRWAGRLIRENAVVYDSLVQALRRSRLAEPLADSVLAPGQGGSAEAPGHPRELPHGGRRVPAGGARRSLSHRPAVPSEPGNGIS